jgi:hypothetical protein
LTGGGERGGACHRGDAEVREYRPPVLDQHVRGFDVSVQDSGAVCGVECVEDLDREFDGAVLGDRPLVVQDFSQRRPVDQLHHDPWPVVVQHDVVHGDDARMPKPRRGAGFTQGPLIRRISRLAVHLLDRDHAIKELVVSPPYHSHPAPAELTNQGVPANQLALRTPGHDSKHSPAQHPNPPPAVAETALPCGC